jgi:hypothetical protein
VPVSLIEKEIADALNSLKFSKAQLKEITFGISEDLKNERLQSELEIKRQKQRLNRLQIEQENLLQSYYDKVIEAELMKKEQKRISRDIKLAESVMTEAEKRLVVVNGRRDRALEIAQGLNLGEAFLKANPIIKRLFCQAIFSKISVADEVTYASQKENCRCVKNHKVTLNIEYNEPIDIRHLTEAILVLSLEK